MVENQLDSQNNNLSQKQQMEDRKLMRMDTV